MSESPPSRPGWGQWAAFLLLAGWLALVPLGVMAVLPPLASSPPELWVQLELVAAGQRLLPAWAVGLLVTVGTLAMHLLVFLPVFLCARQRGHEFLATAAGLLVAVALYQALNALASLPWPEHTLTVALARTAALRLALVLPFLLLGLGWIEARSRGNSLLGAWRRVGLRLWHDPAAIWLALGVGAAVVWPWVTVGSLGSPGTTAANLLQALPNALNEELLFRGLAFTWLWRAAGSRRGAVIGSLVLFVAAQGGTVLPDGDWAALPRFAAALLLGLLAVELTVRAGGSIWPAVVVHFLYDWFHLAFVDPRSQEEVLHWLVQGWAPFAAGGLGLLLWIARKLVAARPRPGSRWALAGLAGLAWAGVVALYLVAGVPGFQPDGFLIFLDEQADLSQAASIPDPVERRVWVYHTLVETAEASQAPLRAELGRRGVRYRPHYLINAIEVLERPGLRQAFARQPGVAAVLFQPGMRRYPRTLGLPEAEAPRPRGIEWNVAEVGADRVWELGYTGQGVIVGGADTGVVWDHPALKAAYLGWEAGGAVDHDYHWFDAWDGRAEPWDDHGHGTHTTGIAVGRDGENQIGLAPGARWIACRNMRHGLGNPGSYLACMEFLFAPFPLAGDPLRDADPARGAHVVVNSWGCPQQEGCQPETLRLAVENLRAAGQMMVVSAGNEGPACGTVQDPLAIYDAVLSVGAINEGDRAAAFSSRGPVDVDGSGRLKPELVAPGVNIRSAVPGGYASASGTSMAGPHVTGAVALLWSMEPALVGDIDGTERLLLQTAQRLKIDAACQSEDSLPGLVCGCGGDGWDSMPNHVYGWGQVDVWAAGQALLAGGKSIEPE